MPLPLARHSSLFPKGLLAGLAGLLACTVASLAESQIDNFTAAATAETIHFTWDSKATESLTLWEIPMRTSADPERDAVVIWKGNSASHAADVPRFEGSKDRIYAKFKLTGDAAGAPLAVPHYVTDFSQIPDRAPSPGPAKGKKGLTCILDVKDAAALGIEQANENIDIGRLIDWKSENPAMSFMFQGRRIGLHADAVAALDRDLQTMNALGVRVTGILLNYVSSRTPRESPLVHPLTDPAEVPVGPAAFNTATDEGLFYYEAIVQWLARRYAQPGAESGGLGGLVIGNEIQSHWSWYHLGAVPPATLLREYGAALRAADLASRSVASDFPIYVSLEHHWLLPASDDPLKGFTAIEALESIAATSTREGDFPWNLAFHPYPENLGNPRFWLDQSAPMRFDAPRITFRNLEVLPAFLRQPRFLYQGGVRRIALTEQGFHCPDGPDGETIQAAAYALAWKKVQALPEIESFLYHRHVDHPLEGGLRCGVREHDGSSNLTGIGKARKIWQVMQKAGTPEEDAAFQFALPIIGRTDWSALVTTQFEPPKPSHREPGRIVFDFVERRADASQENLLALEAKRIGPPDEVPRKALQEHPRPKGLGKLTYQVKVPAIGPGQKCVLAFEALLNNSQCHGVAFGVRVDGSEAFAKKLSGGESASGEIDATPWSGREARIEFTVDALGDSSYAWATWVAPRLAVRD